MLWLFLLKGIINMDFEQVLEIFRSEAVSIVSEESIIKKLGSGKRLKIKLGADPSRPDLHLGHSVILRKLKLLQRLGHEIIFVIGDYTAMIGDPTAKSKTRPPLTFEQTRENSKSYFEQVYKILDRQNTTVVYNSSWLSKMSFTDVLSLLGKYTLARIMERNDFSKRYLENSPIGLHELVYPLMQGYDSVALNADIEVGGSDQIFNLLVGREIQKSYGQQPQDIIAFPLLVGLDGKEKMSKSLNNYIALNDGPSIMFEKCMKVPDNFLLDYSRLTTDIDTSVFKELFKNDIRQAHLLYSYDIVAQYHGTEQAENAKQVYIDVSAGSIPDNVDTLIIDKSRLNLIEALRTAGFAQTNSDARRLITGRGIKIDNEVITDINYVIEKSETVIRKGKNRFVKVLLTKC